MDNRAGKTRILVKKLEPTSGDEGNAVIGITLERNDGMEERSVKLIIRQEQTGGDRHGFSTSIYS